MSATAETGFAEAADNHLRDALRVTHAERWEWLQQAMELGFRSARARARRGLTTLGPHGEVIWSARHEQQVAMKGLTYETAVSAPLYRPGNSEGSNL